MRLRKPNGALFLYRTKRLFNLRAWNPKLLIARLGVIVLVLVAIGLTAKYMDNDTKTTENDNLIKQISALQKEGDCLKGLSATKGLKTDPGKPDYSMHLLSYRIECQLELNFYSAAVSNLKELIVYQEKAKLYDNITDTQQQIKSAQRALRYESDGPSKGQSGPPIDYSNQLWDKQ